MQRGNNQDAVKVNKWQKDKHYLHNNNNNNNNANICIARLKQNSSGALTEMQMQMTHVDKAVEQNYCLC